MRLPPTPDSRQKTSFAKYIYIYIYTCTVTSLLVWALQASTNTTILNTLQPLCLHFLRASCILRHYLCSRSLPCSSHKMKCKLPDCCGYNRLDNSCSSRACSLYRPSKRTLLNTWVYKLEVGSQQSNAAENAAKVCKKILPEAWFQTTAAGQHAAWAHIHDCRDDQPCGTGHDGGRSR